MTDVVFRIAAAVDNRSRVFAAQAIVVSPDQTLTEITMEQGAVVGRVVRNP